MLDILRLCQSCSMQAVALLTLDIDRLHPNVLHTNSPVETILHTFPTTNKVEEIF